MNYNFTIEAHDDIKLNVQHMLTVPGKLYFDDKFTSMQMIDESM